MLFVSKIFLFYFLPLFFLFYYSLYGTARMAVLALFSAVFYGWWNWRFLFLLTFSITLDYFIGRAIYAASSSAKKKRLLLTSIIANLVFLGFFKYFLFINANIASMFQLLGISYPNALLTLKIVLPIGISFYTFQSLSYAIDVYRGEIKPQKNYLTFFAFVSMFPQLVAGPIVRYSHLAAQLSNPVFTSARFYLGCQFFILGLAKKVLIADVVARVADRIFSASSFSGQSGVNALLGLLAYTMQIYFDFSGYSDMATGLGYFCGFQFPKNFDSPYKSKSLTEFWRRWHITLSFWLRDYLYIPLGGNRKGKIRTYVNLMLTMFIGGLWHGASWNFAIWGTLHGLFLATERFFKDRYSNFTLPQKMQLPLTFFLVSLTWIFFRSPTLDFSFRYVHLLTRWRGLRGAVHSFHEPLEVVIFCLGLILIFRAQNTWEISPQPSAGKTLALSVLFLFSIAFLFGTTSHPFLYFQF